MRFTDNRKTCVSAGRDCRYVETDEVTNIRVIADVSSVEVFVNDGEYIISNCVYNLGTDIHQQGNVKYEMYTLEGTDVSEV